MESAACPICGQTHFRPVEKLRDRLWYRAGEFEMVQCLNCGHGFLQQRPTREHIGFYYEGLYDNGGLSLEERLQRSLLARALNWRRLRALNARRKFETNARHLDVGCGVSSLLKQVGQQNRPCVGLDFESAACDSTKEFCAGMDVQTWCGTLEIAVDDAGKPVDFEEEKFASASLIHYLEHTFTPIEDLRRVYRMLETGGAVVMEIPTLESLNRRFYRAFWLPYLPPQHLSLFTRRSLRRALEDAGFTGVRIRGASAPFVGLSSFAIWYVAVLGKKSRLPRPLQFSLWPLALVLGVLALSFDLSGFWWWAKTGRADHLRATAIKK